MRDDPSVRLAEAHRTREALRRAWDATRNPDLMRLVVLAVPRWLRAARVGVFVASRTGDSAWLEAGTGVVERQIVVSTMGSMVGEVLASGTPVRRHGLDPATHQPAVRAATGFAPRSALTVPVFRVDGSSVIGAIQVLDRLDGAPFDDDDLAALTDVGFTIQQTLEAVYDAQSLLDQACALDEEVRALDQAESAFRGDNRLRTFPPSLTDADGGFLHHRWRGKRYPPFIDPESTAALCEGWDTDPEDVFIATHQKVGTHLTKKFAVEVLRTLGELPEGHPYQNGDIGHGTVPWPEVLHSQHGHGAFHAHLGKTAGHPRLWYLHAAYEDFPARRIHPRTRFVVVLRDPRSVLVSQFHFWKRHPLLRVPADLSIDALAERFLRGDLYFGDYHAHVLGWLRRSDGRVRDEQVLVLRYEDLVEDKATSIARLAAFLTPGRVPDAAQIAAIAAATGFDAMKEEMTHNPRSFHFSPAVFFRAGTTRDWEAHLSADVVARIDAKSSSVWGGDDPTAPPEAFTAGWRRDR